MHQQLNCTNISKWRHCTHGAFLCFVHIICNMCLQFCLLFLLHPFSEFSYAASSDIYWLVSVAKRINMCTGTCTLYEEKKNTSQLFGDLGRCTTVYLLFSACHVISNMCSFITNWVKKQPYLPYFLSHMQIGCFFRFCHRRLRCRHHRMNPCEKDINCKLRHLIYSIYYVRATWVTLFNCHNVYFFSYL